MAITDHGNPFMTPESFRREGGQGMTRAGVAAWLTFAILLLVGGGAYSWSRALTAFDGFDFSRIQHVPTGAKDEKGKEILKSVVVDPETGEHLSVPEFDLKEVYRLALIGSIGGFLLALVIIFRPQTAPLLLGPYAILEGLSLGGISAIAEVQFEGIVMQAVGLTACILLAMLSLFATGLLRATGPFRAGLLACMLGVLGLYLFDLALTAFGSEGLSIIHSNSWTAIGFSCFVCLLAAFNFIVDFETIEEGVRTGAPKYMAAYAAFGVLVTLVWLYIEILRLLIKSRSNRDD
jgi:uncharacterized YccA/Bax inhibitor family protein